jgi:hypothetical protein
MLPSSNALDTDIFKQYYKKEAYVHFCLNYKFCLYYLRKWKASLWSMDIIWVCWWVGMVPVSSIRETYFLWVHANLGIIFISRLVVMSWIDDFLICRSQQTLVLLGAAAVRVLSWSSSFNSISPKRWVVSNNFCSAINLFFGSQKMFVHVLNYWWNIIMNILFLCTCNPSHIHVYLCFFFQNSKRDALCGIVMYDWFESFRIPFLCNPNYLWM